MVLLPLTSAGRSASARSVFNHPDGVLRRRSWGRKELTGSKDHRCEQPRIQPVGLPVQQPGKVFSLFGYRSHSSNQVIKPDYLDFSKAEEMLSATLSDNLA